MGRGMRDKLQQEFSPRYLLVADESHAHVDHTGIEGHRSADNPETHFKVFCVSEAFEGISSLQRQRAVNALLQEEFKGGLHYLGMSLHTPSEYEAKEGSLKSKMENAVKQALALEK
jgi:BolA protein